MTDSPPPPRWWESLWLPVAAAALVVVLVVTWLSQPPAAEHPAPAIESVVEPIVTPTPVESAPPQGPRVDPDWTARVSAATGIPARALVAYGSAELALRDEQPACGVNWATLAGIAWAESDHGRHDGAMLGDDGVSRPVIRGVALPLRDTDDGRWDGDPERDRAVGPLQFIPDSWARWGADGDGDGAADPDQIDDAALTAARYLCDSGSMRDADGWRAAVYSFNALDSYVDDVAARASAYAEAADAG